MSVLATWHFNGYPNNPGPTFSNPGGLSLEDIVTVPQIGVALAFAFRTDNSGSFIFKFYFNKQNEFLLRAGPPYSIAEIQQNHAILRQSYPGAQIISSSLQNFLEDVEGIASEVELFDRDVADSWLQGITSDPKRVQQYLALQRALATCFERSLCTKNDEQLINASRFSIKIPGKNR